jgi:hypothetical protein
VDLARLADYLLTLAVFCGGSEPILVGGVAGACHHPKQLTGIRFFCCGTFFFSSSSMALHWCCGGESQNPRIPVFAHPQLDHSIWLARSELVTPGAHLAVFRLASFLPGLERIHRHQLATFLDGDRGLCEAARRKPSINPGHNVCSFCSFCSSWQNPFASPFWQHLVLWPHPIRMHGCLPWSISCVAGQSLVDVDCGQIARREGPICRHL